MNPLSAAYAAAAKARNLLYDTGLLSGELRGPVVSIGSLSAGGAGKTPFLILLGESLKARGIKFDVLSRGYGRKRRGVRLVDATGSAADFGDEPLLIARKLGVPVIVGEDRFLAGELAERNFGPQLHLLDDGFQHRGLARDFDIVLLTKKDMTDRLFPMGLLREPMSSLKRAHAIVLMDEGMNVAAPPYKLLWRVHRGVRIGNTPPRQVAFCGIARPKRFFRELREAGLEPLGEIVFPDHHPYSEKDVSRLLRTREELKSTGFVTTEKDAVNLGSFSKVLEPLHVVHVRMELEDPQAALDAIMVELDARQADPA
ncbi:MAG TPA: tetraacyldisaccharide 4'-kinase [Terriglobales bacterium]|nr:tetraacyldisaccharide 4'-kinase [Terriglobales bacterium]